MDDHRTAKLWLPEHGSVGHSPPVHRLRQIRGLVNGALLRSVRTSRDHYPWSWNGRTTEHIVAAVHTTMCIPEQHRQRTTKAITTVEWHTGNTHSFEVKTRNPSFNALVHIYVQIPFTLTDISYTRNYIICITYWTKLINLKQVLLGLQTK